MENMEMVYQSKKVVCMITSKEENIFSWSVFLSNDHVIKFKLNLN